MPLKRRGPVANRQPVAVVRMSRYTSPTFWVPAAAYEPASERCTNYTH